ncbi:hypothetical protein A3C26_01295 [Candidatus Daviesbacteria bacterium RIFCSPHIGHO2_02_FULL_39_12]|uniref:Uncharacterized protein n=2 Tax=Candidatus Daviesiibacteriota TaxID=1752718 RepID=A0A1F5JC12_9BACT|nr:MAG: hypothetical protein A3C26_01295 [Candidatus Daviesbacteria bacterium RIFCSPHIGHO2_02_FULL_39_12]OGE71997.1 MAG: hypothetical protein A3H40_00445 [Candidatus Daviesbacteria bacterium RIFCSPLOWO2_02_FULL_38_15]
MALLAGNPFPDATDTFFDRFAESMTLGLNWPITINRPFKRLNKPDVIQRGAHLPLNLISF